jgi:sulfatase modifying factor 1
MKRLVSLPGGIFLMGTDDPSGYPEDGEGPVRKVELEPFRIASTTVTNAQFSAFVKATSYVTEAERDGSSAVYEGFLAHPQRHPVVPGKALWRCVSGASWREPFGPGSAGLSNHPVVHVTWNDAQVYCAWSGTRLPSEAEWEYAARGGLVQKRYPWGDELTPGGQHMCNLWQGDFPAHNTADDGYLGTAPAKSYPPNGFGLYNMAGNVWEWCSGWFVARESRATRGGSHLCHEVYCHRYRVAARSGRPPHTSSGHTGFRVAA